MMDEARLESYLGEFRLKKMRLEQAQEKERAQGLSPDIDYLVFSIAGEEMALPMARVRVTMRLPNCTPVPFVPAYHKGIVNIRGRIVSVIDLRHKLAADPRDVRDTAETALIVIDSGKACIGFAVDSINRVLSVKNEQELSPVAPLNLAEFLLEAAA